MIGAITFILTGCDTGNGPSATPDDTDTNPVLGESITVYMKKPAGWPQLYAYVWDDGGTEYAGSGSGTALTGQSGGYYSFQTNQVENGYINVRFNDGASNSTLDILDVETDTYYQSAGVFSGDDSKIRLVAGVTGNIAAPALNAVPAATTVTLNWNLIPDADGYVMYDEFVEYDDDDEAISGSEYWHFQKILPREQTSFLDDNYGEYLEAKTIYTWKLVAVKFKSDFDFSAILGMEDDDLDEEEFSKNYTVLHDFGRKEVETTEGTLPAPTGLKILNDERPPTSVALTWNPVNGADYYMVWWWNDGSDGREEGWYYIEAAFDPQYVDADTKFIFPNTSYKYLVEARANDKGDGPLYGKWSSEVSVTTPPEVFESILVQEDGPRMAKAAPVLSQIPAPPAPKLEVLSSGKVRVTMSGSSSKYRKFQIIDGSKTQVALLSGKKLSLSKDISVPAGKIVYLSAIELPYGPGTTNYYSSKEYVQSKEGPAASVFIPPKLSVAGKVTNMSGSGAKTVKTITVTVIGWPSGAPYHDYVVSSKPSGITGNWSGDTYTGTIKNQNKVIVYVTPRVNDVPTHETPLKTGNL
jgi:hypothetical protein